MKTTTFVAGLAAALMLAWTPMHGNMPGKAEIAVSGGSIVIEYVAPELKGRDIEVEIQRPGANPWRMGADRPTTLSTPVALKFGDKTLAPGRYVLRAYVDDQGQWWLQAYDSNRNLAAQLPLKASKAEDSAEHLVILLKAADNDAHVTIQWGHHKLDGEFAVDAG